MERDYEMEIYHNSLNLPVNIFSPRDAFDIEIGKRTR